MRRIFEICVVVLMAAWFLVAGYQTVHLIRQWYSPLPLMDYWRVPKDLPSFYAKHLAALWQQHNEHRIIFPEIVYAADMLLLHGRLVLPLVLSSLCYLGVWGVLVWGVFTRGSMEWPLRAMAVLFAGALMFWHGSAAVLATPFQLQFTLLQLAVSLCFAFLALLSESGRNRYVAAMLVTGVVATYSSAQGMLVWPLLVVGALLLKIKIRQTVAIAVCGVIATGAFFIGYRSLGSLHLDALWKHPDYLLFFLASYFSMPFGSFFAPEFGVHVGLWAIGVFACCLAFAIYTGAWRKPLGILVFGTYLYMLATALMTASGRMEFADPRFNTAKQERYITVPLAAWGTLIVTVIWLSAQTRLRRLCMSVSIVAAIAALVGCVKAQQFVDAAAQDFANLQINSMMLRNGIEDAPNLRAIFPDPVFVSQYLVLLRQKQLSLYVHGPDRWIGQDLKSLWPFKTPVAGEITLVYPVEGGLEIYGWSDSPYLTSEEHAVLFVDQNGKVAGFGKRPQAGFPLAFGTWNTPRNLAFVGFVKLTPAIHSLTTYVWAKPKKTLHRMGSTISIPNLTPGAADATGTPITDVGWQSTGAFRVNGLSDSSENGAAPAGPIYGSWKYKPTGELHSTAFETPANGCVVVPVLHGPGAYGLSVELIDEETKKVVAAVPMFDGGTFWQRWRIAIPPGVGKVELVARDVGEDGGEWVAVGALAGCK